MKMGADGGRGDTAATQAVIVAGLGDEDHGEFRVKATAVGLLPLSGGAARWQDMR